MADEEVKPPKGEENIGSFYMGRRPPSPPKRLLPPGVLTVFALAALGGIIWYAYPRGAERYTNLDVPVVKADTAPIKEKPASPGGMEVSHQDSTVFDPLQKNGNAEVEKLTPSPEQPLDKDQAIKDEAIKPMATSPNAPPQLQVNQTANGAEEIIPKAPEAKPPVMVPAPAPVIIPAPAPMAASTPTPAPKVAQVTSLSQLAGVPQPQAKPIVTPKAEAPKKEVKKEEKADTGVANYEVQLGSYRETDEAKKDWSRLQKKFADQLAGLKMRLVKADIPGKGTYYRLRAGMISHDRAHEICDALKDDHGVGCILAKK
jgi:hypothetical protein